MKTTGEDQRTGQGQSQIQSRHQRSSSTTPSSSSNNNNNKMVPMDLKVVDDAFGKTSDLYEDVLQVPSSSTQEEIQLAYFDRRSELFTLLAKIDSKPQSESTVNQRFKVERKMDSVVLAVRILGDPGSRSSYDSHVRPYRTDKSKSQLLLQQQQQHQQQTRQAAVVTTAMTTPERGGSRRSHSTTRQRGGGAVVTPISNTMVENNHVHQGEERTTTIELQPSFASNTSGINRKKTSRGLTSSGKASWSERSAKKKRQDPSSPSKDSSSNGWFPFTSSHFNTGSGSSFRKNNKSDTTTTTTTKPQSSKNAKSVKLNDATAGVSIIVEGPTTAAAATTTTATSSGNFNGSSETGKKSSPSIAAAVLAASSSSGTMATEVSKSNGNSKKLPARLEAFESGTSDADASSAVAESMTMESRQGDEEETVQTMSTFDVDYDDDEDEDGVGPEELGRVGGKKSSKGKKKSSKSSEDGMFSCITASKYLKTVSDEISGACEDTLISVDQVFNAFTLTDKDIKAVTKKIDKAKRQLDN